MAGEKVGTAGRNMNRESFACVAHLNGAEELAVQRDGARVLLQTVQQLRLELARRAGLCGQRAQCGQRLVEPLQPKQAVGPLKLPQKTKKKKRKKKKEKKKKERKKKERKRGGGKGWGGEGAGKKGKEEK